jgi:hypothetical protein
MSKSFNEDTQTMMKYKLINSHDGNDSIEFDAREDQDPADVALEVLGWTLVSTVGDEDDVEPYDL